MSREIGSEGPRGDLERVRVSFSLGLSAVGLATPPEPSLHLQDENIIDLQELMGSFPGHEAHLES